MIGRPYEPPGWHINAAQQVTVDEIEAEHVVKEGNRMSEGWQVGQSWKWDPANPDGEPILRISLWIPLAMLEPNRYGWNVLPDWDRYFCVPVWRRHRT